LQRNNALTTNEGRVRKRPKMNHRCKRTRAGIGGKDPTCSRGNVPTCFGRHEFITEEKKNGVLKSRVNARREQARFTPAGNREGSRRAFLSLTAKKDDSRGWPKIGKGHLQKDVGAPCRASSQGAPVQEWESTEIGLNKTVDSLKGFRQSSLRVQQGQKGGRVNTGEKNAERSPHPRNPPEDDPRRLSP